MIEQGTLDRIVERVNGLEPDVIVPAKGLSGGIYPITATLMTPEVHAIFDDEPFIHVSTSGGAEPGCAAALAVLEIVEAPGFLDHVVALGARFEAGLAGLPFTLRRLGIVAIGSTMTAELCVAEIGFY